MDNSSAPQPVAGQLVNNSGIDMVQLLAEFELARSYVKQYTVDFQKLNNLVDGISINANPLAPQVGDVTLAGLVRSIPRNSLQQLPTFSTCVNGTKNSIPSLVCTYLLSKTAFNEDTFGKGLLSTLQIGAEQALTQGFAGFMCAMGSMFSEFGTTLRLLHYSDVALEPGVTDSNESGYHYVSANLTPSRVRKIIKNAKNDPNTLWNVPALEQLLLSTPVAKNYSIYESAARQNNAGDAMSPTYEIDTRYETGVGATYVTFSTLVPDTPLRVLETKSKWGYPKVQFLVIDPAPLTPFGISRVRLASPVQNILNIYLGNIGAMLLLNSKPPIFKKGRFLKPVQLVQGAVWETLDPNADAVLKSLDNGSLGQFAEISQEFATKIQTIMGGQTPSVNPTAGSAGFGQTAPGVKAATDALNTVANQVTKILENFLRQYALVALDTLLSEQTGTSKIILDDETKNAINLLSPGAVGADNKITMVWEEFYAAIEEWYVDIDQSLSKDELEAKKRADTQDMLTVLAQNATELGPETQAKVQQLADILMADLVPDIKPIDVGSTVPPMPTPAAGQSATANGQVHETGDLVKLFSSTQDPNLRNAILKAMNLPPESPEALAKMIVPPPRPPAVPTPAPVPTQ